MKLPWRKIQSKENILSPGPDGVYKEGSDRNRKVGEKIYKNESEKAKMNTYIC